MASQQDTVAYLAVSMIFRAHHRENPTLERGQQERIDDRILGKTVETLPVRSSKSALFIKRSCSEAEVVAG